MTKGDRRATGTSPWTLVLHGGAGTIKRTPGAGALQRDALEAALTLGRDLLQSGGAAMDVVVDVVAILEEAPCFNAGKGAVFTHAGGHELDAAVMDDKQRAGAVCSVTTVRNPIRLARLVAERTDHVLLASTGAEAFADTTEVERVANDWFDTDERRAQFERAQTRAGPPKDAEFDVAGAAGDEGKHGTVGCAVLDSAGRMAAGTSTGGLTLKRWMRVGDSPIPGAGVWADARCAMSGTGYGERFLEHALCARVAARVELLGEDIGAAATHVLAHDVEAGTGGVIGVDKSGAVSLAFNSLGMYRGVADAGGRFEVSIW